MPSPPRPIPVVIGPDADHTVDGCFRIIVPSLTANRTYVLNDPGNPPYGHISLWPNGSLSTLTLKRPSLSEIVTLQNGVAGQAYYADLYFDASTGWQVFYTIFSP